MVKRRRAKAEYARKDPENSGVSSLIKSLTRFKSEAAIGKVDHIPENEVFNLQFMQRRGFMTNIK